MVELHTHYENLKVSRTAPPEVIRAAYKSLAQKYHPDRNPNDPNSAKIMVLINQSFEVLSDPIKKNEHDQWIKNKESIINNEQKKANQKAQANEEWMREFEKQKSQHHSKEQQPKTQPNKPITLKKDNTVLVVLAAFILIVIIVFLNQDSNSDSDSGYDEYYDNSKTDDEIYYEEREHKSKEQLYNEMYSYSNSESETVVNSV